MLQKLHIHMSVSLPIHVEYTKVGGPQISSANRKFSDINNLVDLRFRKFGTLRICYFFGPYLFCDLWICNLQT